MVDNPRFAGKQTAWSHVKCFLETGLWTNPMAEMGGWDNLSVKDQGEVQAHTKASPGVREGKVVEEIESTAKGGKWKSSAKPTKSPSPTKSPGLSKAADKVTDAVKNVTKKTTKRADQTGCKF